QGGVRIAAEQQSIGEVGVDRLGLATWVDRAAGLQDGSQAVVQSGEAGYGRGCGLGVLSGHGWRGGQGGHRALQHQAVAASRSVKKVSIVMPYLAAPRRKFSRKPSVWR